MKTIPWKYVTRRESYILGILQSSGVAVLKCSKQIFPFILQMYSTICLYILDLLSFLCICVCQGFSAVFGCPGADFLEQANLNSEILMPLEFYCYIQDSTYIAQASLKHRPSLLLLPRPGWYNKCTTSLLA